MKPYYSIIGILLILCSFTYADDNFDDSEFDDIDFDFSIKKKSTIDDFPMQEIGQEELSNAAIAGALTTHAALQSKKPAYEEKEEENEKALNKDADKINEDNEQSEVDDMLKYSQIQTSAPEFQQPIYSAPNGRTYTEHNTQTVERF
jgi:hypothetical protein